MSPVRENDFTTNLDRLASLLRRLKYLAECYSPSPDEKHAMRHTFLAGPGQPARWYAIYPWQLN